MCFITVSRDMQFSEFYRVVVFFLFFGMLQNKSDANRSIGRKWCQTILRIAHKCEITYTGWFLLNNCARWNTAIDYFQLSHEINCPHWCPPKPPPIPMPKPISLAKWRSRSNEETSKHSQTSSPSGVDEDPDENTLHPFSERLKSYRHQDESEVYDGRKPQQAASGSSPDAAMGSTTSESESLPESRGFSPMSAQQLKQHSLHLFALIIPGSLLCLALIAALIHYLYWRYRRSQGTDKPETSPVAENGTCDDHDDKSSSDDDSVDDIEFLSGPG